MGYLFALSEQVRRGEAVSADLRFWPNPSLHTCAGKVRYFEPHRSPRFPDLQLYDYSTCDASETIEKALSCAASGATRLEIASGVTDPTDSSEDALSFVDAMINSGLLISDLAPALTGPDSASQLADQLRSYPSCRDIAEVLHRSVARLSEIDERGVGAPEDYEAVKGELKRLLPDIDAARILQADLSKPFVEASLGTDVTGALIDAVKLLQRLSPVQEAPESRLLAEFVERYGASEIPLLDALDEVLGIGSLWATPNASPLFDGVAAPAQTTAGQRWSKREAHLIRRVAETVAAGSTVLELTDNDIDILEEKEPASLLPLFTVIATVAASSPSSLLEGDFAVHVSGYSSSGSLLGRYAQHEPDLQEALRAALEAEAALYPGQVLAEIVHLPTGRHPRGSLESLVRRPCLRQHELTFLGRSGAPLPKQIPANDLFVSVREGRFVLRSHSLGKYVLPRLSSAHAFRGRANLAVYRFLCEMQLQGLTNALVWTWGPLLDELAFLPRLTKGRTILALAQWRMGREDIARLSSIKGAAAFEAMVEWQTSHGLPGFVVLADGDQRLPVDFGNPLSVQSLVSIIKGRDYAMFREMFPQPPAGLVTGPEGTYQHDLLVPFWSRRARGGPRSDAAPAAPTRREASFQVFRPGSEWLYAKFYAAEAQIDHVLRDLISPLVSTLSDGWLSWYFVRYSDPEPHVRLRLHGKPSMLWGSVLPRMEEVCTAAIAEMRIVRMELASYRPEVDRYGGPQGMDIAERLFHVDSQAVLRMLELDDYSAQDRWLLALGSVDAILGDFELDRPSRLVWARVMRDRYRREFGVGTTQRHAISARFRKTRDKIEGAFRAAMSGEIHVLRRRSEQVAPLLCDLRASAARGELTRPISVLLDSFVHMHLDRLLPSALRLHELILYDFLCRLYEGLLAHGDR